MALVSSDEAISVVVPIYNGECLLHRALDSILRQTFANWELLAVDDGSTDGTFQALQQYAARDCRIRVIRLPENSGLSAARNAAISEARADYVTYLDHDDEYYPDYLSRVAQLGDKADVLVFGYDVVNAETAAVSAWEPRQVQGNLFARNIVRPLGVAHRRELWARVGGFNEQLWREEDWDFWKRLARAGTEFVFVPEKSGRYYVRPDSLSRVPHLTRQQRESAIANHESGRPIFSTGTPASNTRPIRKIVYAAPHSLIDPTSGAAVATAQGMRFLQTLGFQCRAFCGSRLDLPEDMETVLRRHRIAYRHDTLAAGILRLPVLVASLDGFAPTGNVPPLEVTIFPNDRERQTEFYQACGAFLDADRPDAVVTYGGDPMAETVILLAKNRDLPLVFWLHNFAYYDPRAFASADYVIVPSQFNRRYYWESIGLSTQVLPLVFDWSRVQVAERRPQYLTFINPQTTKGLYVFARIAEQLAARRPDIPVLVMSGRSSPGWQHVTGIDLSKLPNLTV